ncbi:MAG: Glu/Leu/Phe/Val dehydrogenase dimerization domain-containing protein [Patescibacteria group bacterium]
MSVEIERIAAARLVDLPEFDGHEEVYKMEESDVGLIGFIAIHRKRNSHPSLGATRFWKYDSEENALRDALRLSRLMSYKSAIAGLPYGGAKAVIMRNRKAIDNRSKLFKVYIKAVNDLNGAFITGSDVGVVQRDLDIMASESPHVIGVNTDAGYYTALGVLYAIKSVLGQVNGSSEIGGRRFAIQGVGKTGGALLGLLYDQASKIFISDIDGRIIEEAIDKFPAVEVVDPSDIHKQEVDVFCPCALSHVINERAIDEFKCKGIAGAANNQLNGGKAGYALFEKNIIYAPDYVANCGGLISVVDEFLNKKHNKERIIDQLKEVDGRLGIIFKRSRLEKLPANEAANQMAEEIMRQ